MTTTVTSIEALALVRETKAVFDQANRAHNEAIQAVGKAQQYDLDVFAQEAQAADFINIYFNRWNNKFEMSTPDRKYTLKLSSPYPCGDNCWTVGVFSFWEGRFSRKNFIKTPEDIERLGLTPKQAHFLDWSTHVYYHSSSLSLREFWDNNTPFKTIEEYLDHIKGVYTPQLIPTVLVKSANKN